MTLDQKVDVISDGFAEGVQWADPAEIESADETVDLDFTLILPAQIGYDDVTMDGEWSEWAVEADGKIVEYRVSMDVVHEG